MLDNQYFFDSNGVVTINQYSDVPDRDAILFIGRHYYSVNDKNFIKRFFPIIAFKPFNYIIILGKGDCMIDKDIDIPNNVKNIYANNVNYSHPKIKFLPMGSDFRSIYSFSKAKIENKDRDILCYCNFSLNTHSDREEVFKILKDNSDIFFENMGTFLNYSITKDKFFERLGNSKFVICPRGNAIDTFRFYDTIYAGAIPITVKEPFHNEYFFEDLPVLYLNSIDEFSLINKEFLNEKYELLKPKLKTYYKNLDFQVWINNLKI